MRTFLPSHHDVSIRPWHRSAHFGLALLGVPLLLLTLTGTARAQDCSCPANAPVLPEDGADNVPRNTLIWLSAETMWSLGSVVTPEPSFETTVRSAILLLASDGERIDYDITRIDRHVVLHPLKPLEPGRHGIHITHNGAALLDATFTVGDEVDVTPSPPPSLDGFPTSAGGAGGEGGQPSLQVPIWTPTACSPNSSSRIVYSTDPIRVAGYEGYQSLLTSTQSGSTAASWFVTDSDEYLPVSADWLGTSCFFGPYGGQRSVQFGTFDLAGNFSGWTDAFAINEDEPFHDHGYGTGGWGDDVATGGHGHATGGTYGFEDGMTGAERGDDAGCGCHSAPMATTTPLSLTAFIVSALTLVGVRRVLRSSPTKSEADA